MILAALYHIRKNELYIARDKNQQIHSHESGNLFNTPLYLTNDYYLAMALDTSKVPGWDDNG